MSRSKSNKKVQEQNTFDLTQTIDLSELSAVRLKLDKRSEDRFEIGEYMDLRCEIGDLKGELWVPAELADVSAKGCGCKIDKKFQKQLLSGNGKDLLLRFRFQNDQALCLRLKVCRMTDSVRAGKDYILLGCKLDTSTQSYAAYSHLVCFIEIVSTLHRQMKLSKVSVAA